MPGLDGGTSFSIAATYNEKQVGARTHSCLRPPVIGKGSERMLWWQTLPTMPSWRARIRVMKSSGHPRRASIAHMAGRGTLSNAFLRSQKMIVSGCYCSWLFSWSCRTRTIMSTVPRDGLKPHCDSGSTSSASVRSRCRRMRAKLLLAMLRSEMLP